MYRWALALPGKLVLNRRLPMEWIILALVVAGLGPLAAIVIVQGIEMMTIKRKGH